MFGQEQGKYDSGSVSVHSSHTCGIGADCDLTSTARFAEEVSISVEMASGLLC